MENQKYLQNSQQQYCFNNNQSESEQISSKQEDVQH